MKISIFSDCHCGFEYDKERGEDAFLALEESVQKSMDSDLILIAGDMFDSRIPRQDVLARTAKILSIAQTLPTNTRLLEVRNKDTREISPLALRGIPIIAIHGTHERRVSQMVNPVQALEHAGLLVHLHCSTAVFDIKGEKVAIHGMSGVPEKFAGDCLKEWDPRPIENAVNIFMFHQSVEPYIYSPLDPPSIRLEDLPKGFDLYVLGHIHWHDEQKLHDGNILLTGSTSATSLHKTESRQEKGIFYYDGAKTEFVPLDTQRKVFYEEVEYSNAVKGEIERRLSQLPETPRKPIAIVKIRGTVPKGQNRPNFSDIEERFKEKLILKIRDRTEIEGFEEEMSVLRSIREHRLPPEEQGLKILRDLLQQTKCSIKPEEIFEPLAEGNADLVFDILTGKQRRTAS